MKQLLQNFKTGELKLHDIPMPVVQEGGVLIRTLYSVISAGTEKQMIDLAQKSYLGKAKERPDLVKQVFNKIRNEGLWNTYRNVMSKIEEPMPLGYSCVGQVIGVGKGVDEFKVGDLVACAGAGYANHAEYNFVPKNLTVKLNREDKLEESAFVTLGAIAIQGIRQAEPVFGDTVAVIGLGLLGQITVQILKAAGCKVIGLDYVEDKIKLAEQNGMDKGVILGKDNIKAIIEELSNGFGADKVIITASTKSNDPIEMAAEIARDRGTIVMVGVTGMDIPRKPYYMKELTFKFSRSYGPGRYDYLYEEKGIDYPVGYVKWTENRNMQEVIRMIENDLINIKSLITHTFNIDEVLIAYEMVIDNPKKENFIGVLLKYNTHQQAHLENKIESAQRITKSGQINMGLVGAGNFTKSVFMPNFKSVKNVNFKGVASAKGISAKSLAEKYGFEYATSDYRELLKDEQINVVAITTIHNLHASMVIEALKTNKHIYLEKPLCIKEEELKLIFEEYKKHSSSLMIGFNRRFSSHIRKVKDFLGKKTSGAVVTYRVNAGNIPKGHWVNDSDVGGGRIIGEVCHFVDLIGFIVEAKPIKVYAEKININNDEVINEDNILITLTFNNGAIGNILYTSIGNKAFPKERIEIFSGGTVAVVENFVKSQFCKNGKISTYKTRDQDKGFYEAYSSYIDSLVKGEKCPIDAQDIFINTLATFKIKESLKSGRPEEISLERFLED
jgi:predicted dehydrogenase/threonine dehydrogenase-like Zn-dependent dehydrogenase